MPNPSNPHDRIFSPPPSLLSRTCHRWPSACRLLGSLATVANRFALASLSGRSAMDRKLPPRHGTGDDRCDRKFLLPSLTFLHRLRSSILMRRLDHIDALRGIAALAVCWFHVTHGGDLLGEGDGKTLSSYGFLGGEVFFVISGCVIPLSMWRANYRWRDFGVFFAKRLFWVHPPFCGNRRARIHPLVEMADCPLLGLARDGVVFPVPGPCSARRPGGQPDDSLCGRRLAVVGNFAACHRI
jgi:hypothetical protein